MSTSKNLFLSCMCVTPCFFIDCEEVRMQVVRVAALAGAERAGEWQNEILGISLFFILRLVCKITYVLVLEKWQLSFLLLVFLFFLEGMCIGAEVGMERVCTLFYTIPWKSRFNFYFATEKGSNVKNSGRKHFTCILKRLKTSYL